MVTLNRRAFDVLLYFVQNPGRVLTRDELLKNVWADTFVDENSLAQSISVLRRALEEKPGDNSYIVTLPGRGYQFVAPVQIIASGNPAISADASTVAGSSSMILQQQTIRTNVITEERGPGPLASLRPHTGMRLVRRLVITMAVITVAGIYGWRQFHRVSSRANPVPSASLGTPARRSIAVLGFRNLSGRPEEGWLSTALAEMLSSELEAGEKLRLVSGEDIRRAPNVIFLSPPMLTASPATRWHDYTRTLDSGT